MHTGTVICALLLCVAAAAAVSPGAVVIESVVYADVVDSIDYDIDIPYAGFVASDLEGVKNLILDGRDVPEPVQTVVLCDCFHHLQPSPDRHTYNMSVSMTAEMIMEVRLRICAPDAGHILKLSKFRVGRGPRAYRKDRMGRGPAAGPGSPKGLRMDPENWSQDVALRVPGDPLVSIARDPISGYDLACFEKVYSDLPVGWTINDARAWTAEVYERKGTRQPFPEHLKDPTRVYHPDRPSEQVSIRFCDDMDPVISAHRAKLQERKQKQTERFERIKRQREEMREANKGKRARR